MSFEKDYYFGIFNVMIYIVIGGGGVSLVFFIIFNMMWSMVKDFDFGFMKLILYNSLSFLFEYKRSRDGEVYDRFWIEREYMDVLGCDVS